VDESENVVYDRYVLPDKPILSYLTQLTGTQSAHQLFWLEHRDYSHIVH
jgi:hypothetical protein